MKSNSVYLLTHSYEYGEEEHVSSKELGIYLSKEKALAAIEMYCKLPGFNRYPKECFYAAKYEVDQNKWWTEGFLTWDEASGIKNGDN